MVLLSQMFRTAAITGRTDAYDASWFAGRQGGRRELDELEQRGVLSETEAEALRARLGL